MSPSTFMDSCQTLQVQTEVGSARASNFVDTETCEFPSQSSINSARYIQRIIQTVKSREGDNFLRPDTFYHDTGNILRPTGTACLATKLLTLTLARLVSVSLMIDENLPSQSIREY